MALVAAAPSTALLPAAEVTGALVPAAHGRSHPAVRASAASALPMVALSHGELRATVEETIKYLLDVEPKETRARFHELQQLAHRFCAGDKAVAEFEKQCVVPPAAFKSKAEVYRHFMGRDTPAESLHPEPFYRAVAAQVEKNTQTTSGQSRQRFNEIAQIADVVLCTRFGDATTTKRKWSKDPRQAAPQEAARPHAATDDSDDDDTPLVQRAAAAGGALPSKPDTEPASESDPELDTDARAIRDAAKGSANAPPASGVSIAAAAANHTTPPAPQSPKPARSATRGISPAKPAATTTPAPACEPHLVLPAPRHRRKAADEAEAKIGKQLRSTAKGSSDGSDNSDASEATAASDASTDSDEARNRKPDESGDAKVPCGLCQRMFNARGMATHLRRSHPGEATESAPAAAAAVVLTKPAQKSPLHVSSKTRLKRLIQYAEVRGLKSLDLKAHVALHGNDDDKVIAAMNWFEALSVKITDQMLTREALKSTADESQRPVRGKSITVEADKSVAVPDPPDTRKTAKRKTDEASTATRAASDGAKSSAASAADGNVKTEPLAPPAGFSIAAQSQASAIATPNPPAIPKSAPTKAEAATASSPPQQPAAAGAVSMIDAAAGAVEPATPIASAAVPVGRIAAAEQQSLRKADTAEDAIQMAKAKGREHYPQAATAPPSASARPRTDRKFHPNVSHATRAPAAAIRPAPATAPESAPAKSESPSPGQKRAAQDAEANEQPPSKRLRTAVDPAPNAAPASVPAPVPTQGLTATGDRGAAGSAAPNGTAPKAIASSTTGMDAFLNALKAKGVRPATCDVLSANLVFDDLVDGLLTAETLNALAVTNPLEVARILHAAKPLAATKSA